MHRHIITAQAITMAGANPPKLIQQMPAARLFINRLQGHTGMIIGLDRLGQQPDTHTGEQAINRQRRAKTGEQRVRATPVFLGGCRLRQHDARAHGKQIGQISTVRRQIRQSLVFLRQLQQFISGQFLGAQLRQINQPVQQRTGLTGRIAAPRRLQKRQSARRVIQVYQAGPNIIIKLRLRRFRH